MHRGLLLSLPLLLLALAASSAEGSRLYFQNIWRSWKTVNSKTYASRNEEKLRKRIFINNYMFVRQHNERYYLGLETYSTALNQFADLTLKEFADQYLTLGQEEVTDFWASLETMDYLEESIFDPAPNFIDWRKKGLVTPVKDQVIDSLIHRFIDSLIHRMIHRLIE